MEEEIKAKPGTKPGFFIAPESGPWSRLKVSAMNTLGLFSRERGAHARPDKTPPIHHGTDTNSNN
jgi:hypothetical protein